MPDEAGMPVRRIRQTQIDLREKMAGQHPVHELFAEACEKVGGVALLAEVAEDDPKWFFEQMLKMVPPTQPAAQPGGNTLNLLLHPSLAPGPLDAGLAIDQPDATD